MQLHRYWFELDLRDYPSPPPGLRTGCGVSAYSREDAQRIVQDRVFAGRELPRIANVIEDVDVSTLDQGHVTPNMGLVTQRGVWFPMGYA